MIIDTLVVVVCLMADTPRIQRVEQVSVNRFAEQFQQADSLIDAACERATQSAMYKTRFKLQRVLGTITNGEYRILRQGERELEEMKRSNRNAVKPYD
ncbi:hypothetical protein [Bacteroides sp.]